MNKLIKYRQTCAQRPLQGLKKTVRCFKGNYYSEVPPIKLFIFLVDRGSGWSLFTGGRCSEVVVNTGLTLIPIFFNLVVVKL